MKPPTAKERAWFNKWVRLKRDYENTLAPLKKLRDEAEKAQREFDWAQRQRDNAMERLQHHQRDENEPKPPKKKKPPTYDLSPLFKPPMPTVPEIQPMDIK